MEIPTRIINEARRQANYLAQRMNVAFSSGQLKSWASLEQAFSLVVPSAHKEKPWSYANFSAFRDFWRYSFEARLKASLEAPKEEKERILIDKNVSTFGNVTLFPEQEGCYKAIRDALFVKRTTTAAMQDGHTGSGKTYVAAAVSAWLIQQAKILENPMIKLRPHPIMIFTPKGVVEHWKRILDDMGLAKYVATRKIFVFSYGDFLTSFGEIFCREYEDEITGETTLKWTPILTPYFYVLDECHSFIRPGSLRTQKVLTIPASPLPSQALFMSATPGEKVNDLRTFVLSVKGFNYHGTQITADNWNYFARCHDVTPERPNVEAMKRIRKTLSMHIFSLPYVKPKFKPVNVIWLVDFANEKAAYIYQSAHARYVEACRKSGQNTSWGQFERFIQLNNFRKTAEPLRAPPIADRIAENFFSGKIATAMGCAFKETAAEVMFILSDKYKIGRENVSFIWGGKRHYKTEDLYTRSELEEILKQGMQAMMGNLTMLKRVRLTLKYIKDQQEHQETPEEQVYRHAKLKEMKLLGKQSDDARQVEIDRFQNGTTKIALFTLASGGIGLSLDRDKPFLLPREGIFTPVYNGKEFLQALGRLVRRASLSDAIQRICMMRGTVEQWHVAPILDVKMKSSAALTNRQFNMIDLLEKEPPTVQEVTKLRSEIEATLDAEKDDTIISSRPTDDEDDDEESEDLNIIP